MPGKSIKEESEKITLNRSNSVRKLYIVIWDQDRTGKSAWDRTGKFARDRAGKSAWD